MYSNSISSPKPNLNTHTNTTNAASAAATAAAIQEKSGNSPDPAVTARFTPRAARLAKLNQEYELASPDFAISESFLNRMAALALMRYDEAEVMVGRLTPRGDSEPRTETIGEMEAFIALVKKNIAHQPHLAELDKTLGDTATILDHLEISKSRAHDADIAITLAALGQYFEAEGAPTLSTGHQQSLEDIKTAMVVAYKLNPMTHNSRQLNAYARVSANLL